MLTCCHQLLGTETMDALSCIWKTGRSPPLYLLPLTYPHTSWPALSLPIGWPGIPAADSQPDWLSSLSIPSWAWPFLKFTVWLPRRSRGCESLFALREKPVGSFTGNCLVSRKASELASHV